MRETINGVEYVIDSKPENGVYSAYVATGYELANPEHRVLIGWDVCNISIGADAESVAVREYLDMGGYDHTEDEYADQHLGASLTDAYIIREL